MKKTQRGASLIETLVAILIFSLGVLALVAMQAQAVAVFSDSKYRADASILADSLLNEMWLDPTNIATYQFAGGGASVPAVMTNWMTRVRGTLPQGDAVVVYNAVTFVATVTVNWTPPDGQTHNQMSVATIRPVAGGI